MIVPAGIHGVIKIFSSLFLIGGLYLLIIYRSKPGKRPLAAKAAGLVSLVAAMLLPSIVRVPVVHWTAYRPEVMEQALKDAKPVALDFSADWCVPCIQLDEKTYSDPRVIQELERFVRVRADVTDMKSPKVQEILSRYEVESVPVLLFIDSQGREVRESRVDGFVEPEELVMILKSPRLKDL